MSFAYEIPYEGTVIRPPSEADSLIVQLTLGCSDNGCVFCPAFKEKTFRIKPVAVVEEELRRAAEIHPGTQRIFFADGDALIASQQTLTAVFAAAGKCFPALQRIALYGSVKSVERKTVEELRALKALKLGVVYLGFETGDPELYRWIGKYGSPEGNVIACRKVKEAGLKTNVTVILGLGGRRWSRQHAEGTARILGEAQPHQVAALTLMVAPNTPLYGKVQSGEFELLDEFETLAELRHLVAGMRDFRCLFFANHASNYLPVSARFPKDRAAVLAELDRVIGGRDKGKLTPDYLREL